MKEKKLGLIFYFTLIYMAFFTIYSIINRNYEFIYYIVIMSILIFIIVLYHKKIHLSNHILLGLTILGVFHLLGGTVFIAGTRLYDLWLIPPNILKFDNLIHAFGIFVATFVVYSLLNPHLDKKIKHRSVLLITLMVLIAMGIGALNEIMELGAVVFFNAQQSVGDYLNNALDLVFNFIGALIACIFIIPYHKKKYKKLFGKIKYKKGNQT
ncbi:DUF2238 domain-containing protein [Nanoarchaeota archaeon]